MQERNIIRFVFLKRSVPVAVINVHIRRWEIRKRNNFGTYLKDN